MTNHAYKEVSKGLSEKGIKRFSTPGDLRFQLEDYTLCVLEPLTEVVGKNKAYSGPVSTSTCKSFTIYGAYEEFKTAIIDELEGRGESDGSPPQLAEILTDDGFMIVVATSYTNNDYKPIITEFVIMTTEKYSDIMETQIDFNID